MNTIRIRTGRRSAAITAVLVSLALAAPAGVAAAESGSHAATTGRTVPAQVEPRAFTPIEQRYWNEPHLRVVLGQPVDTEYHEAGVSWQQFQYGWMFWTETTGAHEVHGAIADRYIAMGGHRAFGVPQTDERPAADGVGRYNDFTGTDATGFTSVYWHPETGAHGLWGPIREFWEDARWEQGYLSYPTSTTASTPPGNPGLFSHFRGADGHGASVYWSVDTGAHSVQGAIRQHWASLGWERSYLGFPVSNEYDVAAGRRSDFEGGYIAWNSVTGRAYDMSW